jgi:gamma-glutamyltranspeptidase/glutathione hydrolase
MRLSCALLLLPGLAQAQAPVVLEGRHGMVVGTTGAPAVRAGLEAMRQGGSAVDAALTTSLMQIALAAGSWVSYAGFMTLVHYDAATGRVESMNAGFNTVKGETDPLTIPPMGTPSGRTALVPGFMAGVEAAHRRFGRLPFARLFEPAIQVAEEGVPVGPMLGAIIGSRKEVLGRLEEPRRIFTKSNGEFYVVGDHFAQRELAATLRKVATEGASYMYRGAWAEKMVALVRREGGKMTLDDLSSYEVLWNSPVRTTIRDFDIYATGLPNVGGMNTLEALNLIEAAKLRDRPHYSKSADALYALMQISRAPAVFGPEAMGGAPPELVARYFPTIKPGAGALLSKDAARAAWNTLAGPGWKTLDSALRARSAGENSEVVEGILKSVRRPPSHSDAVVAIDSIGNMVALVHTINTVSWGTTGIFVDGVSIPDPATFQQQAIQMVGPGKRLPEQTNPLLVLRGGKPYLASSSIGSGLFQITLQTLHNVLDFGMSPQAAVDTAQFLKNEWLPKEAHIITVGPGVFQPALLDSVQAKGQPVREVPPAGQGLLRGYWVGIARDPATGRLRGGRSTMLPGGIEAY